jgi:GNAT superfamily N-acetyltransferase
MTARVATARDLDGVTATLTAAFAEDPLWSWAFPDRESLAAWWRFHLSSALRYPWVWVVGDYDAASVWIPPEGVELTDEEEGRVESILRDLIGVRAAEVIELLERFERTHPRDEPHYYLSLLGIRPDRRGSGLGMGLLAENLARIDSEGMPAFLESSNSANDHRYERLGFERVGQFTRPDEAVSVSTMWRPARPASG